MGYRSELCDWIYEEDSLAKLYSALVFKLFYEAVLVSGSIASVIAFALISVLGEDIQQLHPNIAADFAVFWIAITWQLWNSEFKDTLCPDHYHSYIHQRFGGPNKPEGVFRWI